MEKDKELIAFISQMTVEEKVGQMQQLSKNAVDADVFSRFQEGGLPGSYLHVLGHETGEFDAGVQNSRLRISPIFGIDAIHGHSLLRELCFLSVHSALHTLTADMPKPISRIFHTFLIYLTKNILIRRFHFFRQTQTTF